MSLESGLDRLSGLVNLVELDVSGMRARIGVNEVEWMTQHWPRLRIISGLCGVESREAIAWLKERHPMIKIKLVA